MMKTKPYDVFLSFNSEDRDEVEKIAVYLKEQRELCPWFDEWDLIPGVPWVEELERGLKASSSCAVFVGKSGRGPWQQREVETALQQQVQNKKFRVIPVLLPDAPKKPRLPAFLSGNTWVDFRKKGLDHEDTLWRLECGIRGKKPGKRKRLSQADPKTPSKFHKQTQVTMDSIEFVNRSNELQFITNIYCPPYLLISAPAGYGKTRLVENVKQRLQQPNSLFCIHLELLRETIYSIKNLSVNILKQLGEKHPENMGLTTPEKCGYEVGRCILKTLKNTQQKILMVIDNSEVLNGEVAQQMLNQFIPAIKEGLMISEKRIQLQFIAAGRCFSHWKPWNAKIPLKLMPLTSFDFPAVYETVENFASTSDVKSTTQEYKESFAARLMYFTGGHPGCMVKILTEDYGCPIRLIDSKEKGYYETIIKPVIEEIQGNIPSHLQEVFEKLSVFRMYNYPLLEKIIEERLISYSGTAMSLQEELTATYLVKRRYGFIQDDIVRRLFVIKLRKEEPESKFLELCRKARQIYEKYLQETTYNPHTVALEGLYQELQFDYYQGEQNSKARKMLLERFFAREGILQKYLQLLADKPDNRDILANLKTVLLERKDLELQFALNFFLRENLQYTEVPYQQLLREVEQFTKTIQKKKRG